MKEDLYRDIYRQSITAKLVTVKHLSHIQVKDDLNASKIFQDGSGSALGIIIYIL